MKIAFILLVFVACAIGYSSAQISKNSYQVSQKTPNFDQMTFDHVTNMNMLDLYRSEKADNRITVIIDGEQLVITLLSAQKCRKQGISFDEGLVEKGKLMGTKPDVSENFNFEIDEELKLIEKY
jgi:archaellum component FlaG (FlaF/FlaG flagellin family)